MTNIKTIAPENATGEVAIIYEMLAKNVGFVPNGFQVFSSNPALLENQFRNLGFFLQHPRLGGDLLAMIRMLVSVKHSCQYCINLNMGILMEQGYKADELQAARQNPAKAPLEEKEKALLLFVLKVVADSLKIEDNDLNHLRKIGWDDADIFAATYHGTSQVGFDAILNAFKVEADVMVK